MDKQAFKELGHYLREKRIKKDLTQVDVAEKLGYRSQFIANWERGASSPPIEALKKLIGIYGISQKEIMNTLCGLQSDYWKRNLFSKKR